MSHRRVPRQGRGELRAQPRTDPQPRTQRKRHPSRRTPRHSNRTRKKDRGSASIELLGFLPVLLLVGLAALQLGLAAYAVQQAGTAARAAARTATQDAPRTSPAAAGRAALSTWLSTEGEPDAPPCGGAGQTTASVTVRIPTVLPFLGDRSVTRRATMRCPTDPLPPVRSVP